MTSENEKEYDFLKLIYESRLNDRKYIDDKALTLIQTNGILLVILSAFSSVASANRIMLPIWIQVLIFIMVVLYLASALCGLYAIYPRETHREEIASDQITSYYENRLRSLKEEYEKTILPLKAIWLSRGMRFFALGVLVLAIVVIYFAFSLPTVTIDP